MPTQKLTTDILNAAIEGLEAQKSRIEANIAEIRQMMRGNAKPVAAAAAPGAAAPKSSKRTMSAAGRAAIAAAQRKRWAAKKKAAK